MRWVAIDPGHGGIDVGAPHYDAAGKPDAFESDINLALALRLRQVLVARGYGVLMTREDDSVVNVDEADVNGDGRVTYVDDLQARVDQINASSAELLLSIHQNAFYYAPGRPGLDVGGTVTFYCADRPFAEESLRLGRLVQAEVVRAWADLGHESLDRGVLDDATLATPDEPGDHLILLGPETERIVRPSQVPGVLSETAFLTHPREFALLGSAAGQERLALAYADAIVAFLESAP
ncbi:MAG: N-acetylmuramoyl-L-alanine amidase [Chloroflexota bacterium]